MIKNTLTTPVTITMPGRSNTKSITFYDDYLETHTSLQYKYDGIDGVSYSTHLLTVNALLKIQQWELKFLENGLITKISFSRMSFLNYHKNAQELAFNSAISLFNKFIHPILLKKLLSDILILNKEVNIGKLSFTNKGMYYTNTFNNTKWIYWSNKGYSCTARNGYFIVSYNNTIFCEINMKTLNAPMIALLLDYFTTRTDQ